MKIENNYQLTKTLFDKNAYEKKFMKNSTGMLWQYILAKIGANTAENELAKIS